MTQTGGLVILLAQLIFAALLAVLTSIVLRPDADPVGKAQRRPDESLPGPDGLLPDTLPG